MGSVRARAALGATAVVAVALVVAGLLMLVMLRDNLDEQVDLQAELAAREIAAQLATENGLADLELGAEGPVQVLDGEGRVIAVSDDLEAISGTPTDAVTPVRIPAPNGGDGGGTDPTPQSYRHPANDDGDDDSDDSADDDSDDGDTSDGDGDDTGTSDDDGSDDTGTSNDDGPDDSSGEDSSPGDDSDGEDSGLAPGEVGEEVGEVTNGTAVLDGQRGEYRFASVDAVTTRGQDVTVYAGAPLDVEQAAVNSVRTSMLVGLPVLLAVVAGVTWLVTRRALRPVEGIRQEMVAIMRSEDLSRRVPQPASRDEVGRLARTTNETLAALEASVERQRRFVADASHELRSPIASLRTQLEVGEAHPELLDVPGAVQDTVRLQDLAADLLLLARLDAGERPQSGAVELDRLVGDELERRAGGPVPVRSATIGLPAIAVSGSRGQLARVLGNLLDNAQRHARGAVRVSLRRDGAEAVVEVADDGAGVPEADRERIFQRFVRLDDARSRDDGGAGLGLAIARDVAVRHGGSLGVDRAPEGGALFVLRLPAA
ncbi:HAMP domain-containing sensor histidine kinase [Streptomyces sp. B6B3]|uniref:sensor histidine kinase n=1 Tax=Streptomyces sp. B6B3 TaxID=3153570 RepID=UPI00325DE3D6